MSEQGASLEVVESPRRGPRRGGGFGLAFGLSLFAHVALVGGIGFAHLLNPPEPILSQKPVSARLVRLGAKRDKNLLPRREVSAPPPPTRVEVPGTRPVAVKAKDPATPSPSPAAARPAPAAGGLKAAMEKATRSSRLFDEFAKAGAKAPAADEPPEGDPDGDPNGDVAEAEEGERYFGLILAKARRNYGITKTIPPHELARLKATVVLYIGATGSLLRDPEIQVSSGMEQFDQDVLLSLRKAAPFGPPPEHLVKILETVGVAIEATP